MYGRPIDALYYEELQKLVVDHNLGSRVTFAGPLPMPQLRSVYPQHKIMINMASETIDKTMLEAMCNGVFPVTTSGNAAAIGLFKAPKDETPQALANFILNGEAVTLTQDEMVKIVTDHHGLATLISKMAEYIKKGI